MSTKRQPSKQRRQTQNQRQRAALEARRTNAATGAVPDGKVGGEAKATSSGGGGSLLGRLRGSVMPQSAGRATAATAVSTDGPPVGHRAALAALLAAVAGATVGALLIYWPVDASGDAVNTVGGMAGEWTLSAWDAYQDDPSATADELAASVDDWTPNGTQRYGIAYFPLSLTLLLPVVRSSTGRSTSPCSARS
jgi:hypothetical protein